MYLKIFFLAVIAALDPARIAAAAYMLSRARPMKLLVAYLVGGMGVSLIAGGVILFLLKEVGAGRILPAGIEIAVGTLAVVVAVVVGSGLSARLAAAWGGDHFGHEESHAAEEVSGLQSRLRLLEKLPGPVRRVLASESPWVVWVAGVAIGLPSAYYLAAIAILLQAGRGLHSQIFGLLLLNFVAFTAVELPFVGFLFAPDATREGVKEFHVWIGAHRRLVVAALAGGIGAFLVAMGISKLWRLGSPSI
jgi:hypothetical protein